MQAGHRLRIQSLANCHCASMTFEKSASNMENQVVGQHQDGQAQQGIDYFKKLLADLKKAAQKLPRLSEEEKTKCAQCWQ